LLFLRVLPASRTRQTLHLCIGLAFSSLIESSVPGVVCFTSLWNRGLRHNCTTKIVAFSSIVATICLLPQQCPTMATSPVHQMWHNSNAKKNSRQDILEKATKDMDVKTVHSQTENQIGQHCGKSSAKR